MYHGHPTLPGQRHRDQTPVPTIFGTPAVRLAPSQSRWTGEPPISQSRSGAYISPDPSPTTPVPGGRIHNFGSPYPRPLPALARRTSDGTNQVLVRFPGGAVPKSHADEWRRSGSETMISQKQRKSMTPKKAEGKQPTFLMKLYGILEQPEYHEIIRWDDTGEIIIIERPDELADKILPLVYRQSRFASFSRQLNIYGFMRKVSLRHIDRGICDPDASTWSHSFLHRDSSKADISGFKRRVPPRPSQAAIRRASVPDDAPSHSSGSDGSLSYSPPEMFVHRYLGSVEEGKASIFAHGSPMSIDDREECIAVQPINRFAMGPYHPGLSALFDQPTSSMIPQSAPAKTRSFVIPTQVSQGHLRTRSVQGEPPSATMLSSTFPLAQPGWLPMEAQVGQPYGLQIGGQTNRTYNPTDATIWSHQGLSQFSQPASVPTNFAPSLHVPQALQAGRPSFTAALSEDSTPAISPEFYNPAYSNRVYIPGSSREILIGRDPSSISSYHPRALSTVNGSDNRNNGETARQDEDSALPSASLKAFHVAPFESVMSKEKTEIGGHDESRTDNF